MRGIANYKYAIMLAILRIRAWSGTWYRDGTLPNVCIKECRIHFSMDWIPYCQMDGHSSSAGQCNVTLIQRSNNSPRGIQNRQTSYFENDSKCINLVVNNKIWIPLFHILLNRENYSLCVCHLFTVQSNKTWEV